MFFTIAEAPQVGSISVGRHRYIGVASSTASKSVVQP